MPFDLTLEALPPIGPRVELSGRRRSILRRVIGDQTIQRAAALGETAPADAHVNPGELIRLHVNGLLEDLKHDWLAAPIVDLYAEVTAAAAIDLGDDAAVGARLRPTIACLVSRADSVSELVDFIDLFELPILDMLIRPAALCGLGLARSLVDWMTCEGDEDSACRGDAFDEAAKEIREYHVVLRALPHAAQLVPDLLPSTPPTLEQEIELLIDVEYPEGAKRWVDVVNDFDARLDLCELGSRQLRYFGAYHTDEPIWSRNFLELGLRIGQSAFPLLAHRAAYLAWLLFERAIATDEVGTLDALHNLFESEALWMIDSQDDYLKAVDRYHAGDNAAIVEAYSDLAEGTLRRYGSLVVALQRLEAGKAAPEPLVLGTVGEVEDQLSAWQSHPLPALVLRFLERGLRNAEAHANVIVDVQGSLRVRQRDGTVEEVVPNHVYGRTTGLRSVLDGIDVAMNHALIIDLEKHLAELRDRSMPPMSARLFEHAVQRTAELTTQGVVSDIRWEKAVLTVTYHGPTTVYEERTAFADSLIRFLGPTPPDIHILSEEGEVIDILRPPRRNALVGRNEPCPCGSGKKYKRCHGA